MSLVGLIARPGGLMNSPREPGPKPELVPAMPHDVESLLSNRSLLHSMGKAGRSLCRPGYIGAPLEQSAQRAEDAPRQPHRRHQEHHHDSQNHQRVRCHEKRSADGDQGFEQTERRSKTAPGPEFSLTRPLEL